MKRQLHIMTSVAVIAAVSCAETPTEPMAESPGSGPTLAKAALASHKRTVFVTGRNGNQEIYSMSPDGSNEINVSNTRGLDEIHPSLSRDNSYIVFAEGGDLYSMAITGQKLTRLTNTAQAERLPVWSPNGRGIAYTRGPGGALSQIRVMDADGTNVRQVTNFPAGAEHPTWSPDGAEIAFSSQGTVYTVPAMCSLCTVGTQIGMNGRDPAWAPDGSHIIYSGTRTGSPRKQLYAYNIAWGSEIQIVTSGDDDTEPAWSSDGTKLYFTRSPAGMGDTDVWVMDYAHNMFYNERLIQASPFVDESPSGGGS